MAGAYFNIQPDPDECPTSRGGDYEAGFLNMCVKVIERAQHDYQKFGPGHINHESALHFFSSTSLDCWCSPFGEGVTKRIRKEMLGFEEPTCKI